MYDIIYIVKGESLVRLWESNPGLRRYIVDTALRHGSRYLQPEDYVQSAWLRLAEAPYGKSLEWYKKQSQRAIQACYQRERRKRRADVPLKAEMYVRRRRAMA